MKILAALTLGFLALAGCASSPKQTAAPFEPAVVPRLREWTSSGGRWQPRKDARIVVNFIELMPAARQFSDDLAIQTGFHFPVENAAPLGAGDIEFAKSDDAALGQEGYELKIDAHVQIRANGSAGAFYATRTVLQMLRADPARHSLQAGNARDWPKYRERAEMLDVGRKFFPIDYLKLEIRRAAWYKINTYHLHLSDWSGFRIESKRFPKLASEQHYTQAEIRDLVAYAKRYHVTIVPEIDIPAHSVVFSRFDPTLAFRCESMSRPHPVPWEGADVGGWTLDVTKPETREFVEALLDEMIPLFDGPYFHVGGDEIPYDESKNACPELADYAHKHGLKYPNDAFVEFTNWLDGVVKRHGKTMQLWQWWDFKQQHGAEPAKDIVVNQWLGGPMERLKQGFLVIDTDDEVFYECPGLRKPNPGDYCYADPKKIFDYAYATHPNLAGYMYSRWNDGAQDLSVEFLDQRAKRARFAFVDRVWGGPKFASVETLIESAQCIGDVDGTSVCGASPKPAMSGGQPR